MMFGGSNVTINKSDEVQRLVSYKHYIQFKKTAAMTLLLLIMFNLIDKILHDRNAVWRLVHQKLKWVEFYGNCIQSEQKIHLPNYSQL